MGSKKIGFFFFLLECNFFIIKFLISFSTFSKTVVLSLQILKTGKDFVLDFLILFFNSLKIGSKKEGFFLFLVEPKGRSVSSPQTVKKHKSFFSLFFFFSRVF